MSEQIEIPITYKGQETTYQATLLQQGYVHCFQIDINGIPVLFEPDEERKYRVIIDAANDYNIDKIDVALIKIIVKTLESMSA